jgi:hypothetical protein
LIAKAYLPPPPTPKPRQTGPVLQRFFPNSTPASLRLLRNGGYLCARGGYAFPAYVQLPKFLFYGTLPTPGAAGVLLEQS